MSSVWPRDHAAVREGLAAGCSRVGRFPVLRRVAGTVVQRSPPEPRCLGSAPACAAARCVMLDKSLGSSELRLPHAPACLPVSRGCRLKLLYRSSRCSAGPQVLPFLSRRCTEGVERPPGVP